VALAARTESGLRLVEEGVWAEGAEALVVPADVRSRGTIAHLGAEVLGYAPVPLT